MTFSPPIAAPLPGAHVIRRSDRLAGQLGRGDRSGDRAAEIGLLLAGRGRIHARVRRFAESLHELGVSLGRGLAGHRDDLRGQQRTGCPSLSVVHAVPSKRRKRRTGRLLPAEADRAVEQPWYEPLESNRDLPRPSAQVPDNAIDQRRETSVLPIATSGPHWRLANRYEIATAR